MENEATELDDGLTEYERKRVEDEKKDAEFQASVRKDLENNEKYKEFFAQFTDFARKDFIRQYPHTKLMYTKFADLYEREAERAALGMLSEAWDCLKEIQQKKLFDAQCLWRAEKLEIENLTLTWEFDYWSDYVLACPFIDPITTTDVELYIRYLESPDTVLYEYGDYQDYSWFKEVIDDEEEGGVYPEWYEFYDLYRGTGMNIRLPDIKGEKEEFYRKLYFNDKHEKEKAAGIVYEPPPADTRRNPGENEMTEEFIRLFETPKELELWNNQQKSNEDIDDFVNEAFYTLLKAREPVAIEANWDWKEAIMKAARMYENKLLSRALPMAYEQYCMKLQTGIAFYEDQPPVEDDDNTNRVKEQILNGRELNGEPRDFNY